MNSELREAAERLSAFEKRADKLIAECVDTFDPRKEYARIREAIVISGCYIREWGLLARACLELMKHVRPDDHLPIDESWLRSVGFANDDGADWCYAAIQLRRFPTGEWRINMHDWWEYFPDQTRGTIYKLCAALGIPLKEKP